MNCLFIDSNSLSYAFRAGGTTLLDKIAFGAGQAGYILKIADAVIREIDIGPQRAELNSWLMSKSLNAVPTQTLAEYQSGLRSAETCDFSQLV
jgi:hypothetical protein